jgi:uroporphyrinogen-III decarboxylase
LVEDPVGTIVKVQEDLGLDPVIYTYSELEGEVLDWPASLFNWPEDASRDWRIEEELAGQGPGYRDVQRRITTPEGILSSRYRQERSGKWILEYPLKKEKDIDLLGYRPDPALLNAEPLSHMVRAVDRRGFFMHTLGGVWTDACDLRGIEQICYDVYDRPRWLKRLLEMLKVRQISQIKVLAKTGIHSIVLDESYMGMGISPDLFQDFILLCDREIVQSAQEEGLLVIFHNCGKASALLELMADSGADGLETLTPSTSSGDVELTEAKRRVGNRVCLCGGFDERVLAKDDAEQIRGEVRRCMEAAAEGGGYIMRTAGQVLEAPLASIEAMVQAVTLYGSYN